MFSSAALFGIPIKNLTTDIMMPIKILAEVEAGGGYAGEFAKLAVSHKLYGNKDGKKLLTDAAVETAAYARIYDSEDYAAIWRHISKLGIDTANASRRISNMIKKLNGKNVKKNASIRR